MPPTPEPCGPRSPAGSRRWLLSRAVAALSAAVAAVLGVPAVRYLLTPLGFEDSSNTWLVVCRSDQVPAGPFVLAKYDRPARGFAGGTQPGLVWLQRRDTGIFAISAACTHLGCTVTWDAKQNKMLCPCHGGEYDKDGSVLAGPSRRPLAVLPVREKDGLVSIKPTAKRAG
ncbi:MAG: Rieske 2Fe-2S domain-containing protein [Candidatus Riflebacteria bacterium]|nr:Rieske 2Fe-2S domain-containing protein [Candidatus Riflebacteria bacterium]